MLENNFVVLIVFGTTLLAYAVSRWVLGKRHFQLGDAIRRCSEYAGAFVIFLASNLVLGLASILMIRSITPRFVSVYLLEDVMLIVFSAVQALIFYAWWSE